ncbi:MAG: carbohydrate kinase family protein [Anaerolineae bacterium]|nr:carbohydrate kinase family protein [Anaerolineae bacterium]
MTYLFDIYVYGMTVLSTIHRLKTLFPQADSYQEIVQTTVMPGGEGGNAAILLSHWGLKTQLDGCMFGEATAEPLLAYFNRYGVDCSLLPTLPDFDGWRDIVFCDGESRTVFGWFGQHFSSARKLWTEPCAASIAAARCVAVDPFFGETSHRVANLCVQHGIDYVTLDARWDDALAQNARAIACSKEFLESAYPGKDYTTLLEQYRTVCRGLVVFTFGGKEMLYTSPEIAHPATLPAYPVTVLDTLAAGDTFRAGLVYGVVNGMSAEDTVRFAAASAAVCCTRFPSILEPPGLDEINLLMEKYA